MAETANKEAIHEACREGRLAAVESLLAANPKLAARKDSDDRLPLHWACSYNHRAIVQLLQQSKDFDVDAQDGAGWTPLMIACSIKDGDDIIDLLLARGADVNLKNFNGQTPLHFCASKTNLSAARKLLAPPYKASSRLPDKQQQLPIHRAAAIGSVPMVKLLLDNLSPLNSQDRSGLTPLHHAVAEGHGDVAVELLKRGAESDKVDKEGNIPLKLAPDQKVAKWILTEAEKEGIEVALT